MYKLSVVVPIYNEQDSIRELYEELKSALKFLKEDYEIIFVDDGSTDNTFERLKLLEKKDKNVKLYSFRKNLGKSYALGLGFKMANSEYIATIDSDLQDDPKNIRLLFEKLQKRKLDVITGWRKNRKDHFIKVLTSHVFNSLTSYTFGLPYHDINTGLKVYRSQVAKELKLYGGMHRFIPLLVHELGYKISEYEVNHRERRYGQSKFKQTKFITDLPDFFTLYFLTKYTRRPLHFFGKFGSLFFLIGFIILSYLTYLKILGFGIGDRPLLLLGILLVISGMQIILTGLLADLIVRTNASADEDFPLKYKSLN